MKPIRLSAHARQMLRFRGADEAEIADAIRTAPWGSARGDRFDCRRDFAYGRSWNGTIYETKQVRPIFVEEAEEIVVVTVYVYYF